MQVKEKDVRPPATCGIDVASGKSNFNSVSLKREEAVVVASAIFGSR